MIGDGKQHEEDKLDVGADLLLGIEKAAHHSRTGTATVKIAMDELSIMAMGSLYGQGFIKFESFEANKNFNVVVYFRTRVTLKGRVWYTLHTFSILRADAERDSFNGLEAQA